MSIPTARIDHFMYAVPELEAGVAWATQTFGVSPEFGGVHVGLGTQNALLSLGDTYLEIIAPDPKQSSTGRFGQQFAQLEKGGMVTWAAQGNLRDIATHLNNQHIETQGPNTTQRKTTSGELLVWELLFPQKTGFGGRLPFFIDWLACDHPSKTNPVGGQLLELQICVPNPTELSALLAGLDLQLQISAGAPQITVVIECNNGLVELSSTDETVHIYG